MTRVLGELLKPYRTTVSFAMLAPDKRAGKLAYTLFLEIRDDPSPELAERLEVLLGEEFHYRYCVRLGQLAPARVFRIVRDAYGAYVDALRQKMQMRIDQSTMTSTVLTSIDPNAGLPRLLRRHACSANRNFFPGPSGGTARFLAKVARRFYPAPSCPPARHR